MMIRWLSRSDLETAEITLDHVVVGLPLPCFRFFWFTGLP
jgi:hypothetical protein